MKNLRSANRLLFVLIAAAILLVIAGAALLGVYLYLSRQSAAEITWRSPAAALDPDKVAPDLAVLTLAGEPDERVIRAALDAGEIETAYSTLAFSVLLPDTQRSGQWLLLARQYQTDNPQRAGLCYQAALDHVALAPTLSDLARADISLQVARNDAELDKAWISRLALAQAHNIARFSLSLLPAQRRSILTQVADMYDDLGDAQPARTIRANLEAYAVGAGVVVAPAEPLLPILRGAVVLPEPVVAAMKARQQAAAVMAARWLSAGSSGRNALAQALGDALRAEDAARAALYAETSSLELSERLALQHDQVAWLTIKYRVALGGYGLSLVADWEDQRDELVAALSGAYTELINGYGQQLDTLDAVEALAARVELLRQGLLWVRLGLFVGDAEKLLSDQLGEASRQLWTRQGGVGLTVIAQDVQGQRFYLLAGSETAQNPGG